MALVREADRDRYLATLFAPSDRRGALFALHAFNVEVGRVRDLVHEPLPGEIRLQWWRDTIAARQRTGNPVADALVSAIDAHGLPIAGFDQVLEGRIVDLYDDPMPDRTALEAWCGQTISTPIQLAAMILSPGQASSVATMAGHAGCALGVTTLLQRLPHHRARGQCWVPAEILAASGTTADALIAGDPAAAAVAPAMAALAREHLTHFKQSAAALPAGLRPAFLPLAATEATLKLIEGAPAPLTRMPMLSELRRQWLFWRRAARGWKA